MYRALPSSSDSGRESPVSRHLRRSNLPSLPLPPNGFRLLRLDDGWNDTDSVACELQVHRLDDPPAYDAISYTWGDPSQRETVRVNGSKYSVTTNLTALLRRLREEDGERSKRRERYLWVDQLCIDQSNIEERNHQVHRMRDIYAAARSTIIWLGEANDKTSSAVDFLHELHDVPDVDELVRGPQFVGRWSALADITSRAWFKRIWVVQELVLARKAIFYCGSQRLDWHELDAGLALLDRRSTLYPENAVDDIGIRRLSFNVKKAYSAIHDQGGLSLSSLVPHLAALDCADPRDHVYGLLGLARDGGDLRPDYSVSASLVYETFVKWSATQAKSLDIILQSWAPYTIGNELAAWVSELPYDPLQRPTQLVNSSAELNAVPSVGERRYSASGKPLSTISWRFDDNTRELRAAGIVLDVLVKVSSTCPQQGLPEDWLDVRADAKSTSSGKDDFWRVLLADRDPIGTGSPPDDYGQIFEPILTHTPGLGQGEKDSGLVTMRDHSSASKLATHFLYASMQSVIYTRSLAQTQRSTLALVPGFALPGDVICILFGCSVPVVLRSTENGAYQLVGESYVHGYMDGEALDGSMKEEELVISPERIDKTPQQSFHGLPQLTYEPPRAEWAYPRLRSRVSIDSIVTDPYQGDSPGFTPTDESPKYIRRTAQLTESSTLKPAVATTWRQYRVVWTCHGGYRGADLMTEIQLGSIRQYVEALREEGVVCTTEEIGITDPIANALTTLVLMAALTMNNVAVAFNASLSSLFGRSAAAANPGIPMTAQPGGPQQQPVPQVAVLQANPPPQLPDFLLMCIKDSKYLITRHDLNVAPILSDQELFTIISNQYHSRRGYWRRIFSLKSVQRITFVKFALRENNEVDCLQPDNLPPVTEVHYKLDPWPPGRVPPVGNMFLMRRFKTPSVCQRSTFCLRQFPKRIERHPQLGMPPDVDTGWGIHFQEGFDPERVIGFALLGIIISLVFAIPYAIVKSTGDAFTTASWIAGSWLGGMAMLQFAVND